MVKIITGTSGSGKTKVLVDKINDTIRTANGSVVCIEKGAKLTYDLSYKVRLVDADRFAIATAEAFYGFIAGMLASNYDISDIFVDGILRICGRDFNEISTMFEKLDKLTDGATLLFTVSADDADLPESILKYKQA